jgi:hypothetical protein
MFEEGESFVVRSGGFEYFDLFRNLSVSNPNFFVKNSPVSRNRDGLTCFKSHMEQDRIGAYPMVRRKRYLIGVGLTRHQA